MASPLRKLLTDTPLNPQEPRLFRSGLEIGKEIANLKEVTVVEKEQGTVVKRNPWLNKRESAVSIVNQLMRHECSASVDFAGVLLQLINERVKHLPSLEAEKWVVRVKEAIGEINAERKVAEAGREVLETGLLKASRAREFILVYAGLHPFASDFYQLRDVMFPRLGLTSEFQTANAGFHFFYSETANVEEAWRRLFFETAGILQGTPYPPLAYDLDSGKLDFNEGIRLARQHLHELERLGLLSTWTVPRYVVSAPMILIDPFGSNPAGYIGFSAPQEEIGIQVMPIPEQYLSYWLSNVGQLLVNHEIPGMVEWPFSRVEAKLVAEAQRKIYLGELPDFSAEIDAYKDRKNKSG